MSEYKKFPDNRGYSPDINGRTKDIYSKRFVNLMVAGTICFAVTVLILGIIFLFLISQGNFKSTITQTVNPLFNASVNTLNNYEFNPNTVNEYEFEPKVQQNITNNFEFDINCEVSP